MITVRADLHVHTLLSPCADVEMIPPLIVEEALSKGIGLIAITDHNSIANIESVQKAAASSDLIVLPGMELQTIEEVHLLCLFDTLDQVIAFNQVTSAALPNQANNIDFFGEQFIVDETGDFLSREERLLLTSVNLTVRETWDQVSALGGLLIPAHVNRKANGLIQMLGFVPADTPIEILEISRHITPNQAYSTFPQIQPFPLVQDGDAHFLEDILGTNEFQVNEVNIHELRLAALGIEDRSLKILNNSQ